MCRVECTNSDLSFFLKSHSGSVTVVPSVGGFLLRAIVASRVEREVTSGANLQLSLYSPQESVRQLIRTQEEECRIEEPEDSIFEEEEYARLGFGDWRTNGLGHRWVDWGSVKGVLVPRFQT